MHSRVIGIRPVLLKVIGTALIVTGVITLVAASQSTEGYVVTLIVGLIGAVLVPIGSRSVRLGKQYSALEAATKAVRDPRPPVIYLRSFQDDELMSQALLGREGYFVPTVFTPGLNLVSQEEHLAKVIEPIGPFLALGRPGEAMPTLGASRHYVSDGQWREEIAGMLERARLTILRAGLTKSLVWELCAAVAHLCPEQLVLLVPSDQESYDAFRIEADKHLPRPLPTVFSSQDSRLRRNISVSASNVASRGVIVFNADWTPNFYTFEMPPKKFWRTSKQSIFAYGFRPVFSQLGVEWNEPPHNWGLIGLFAVLLALFIGWAVFGLGYLYQHLAESEYAAPPTEVRKAQTHINGTEGIYGDRYSENGQDAGAGLELRGVPVGNSEIVVPVPAGFRDLGANSQEIFEYFALTITPPGNRLLALFITDDDYQYLTEGLEPDLARSINVQIAKAGEHDFILPHQFAIIAGDVKNQQWTLVEQFRKDIDQHMDDVSESMQDTHDIPVAIQLADLVPLGIFFDWQEAFGMTYLLKGKITTDGMDSIHVLVTASSFILVRNKIIHGNIVSTYQSEDDIEWAQQLLQTWTEDILRANH